MNNNKCDDDLPHTSIWRCASESKLVASIHAEKNYYTTVSNSSLVYVVVTQ
jgi:hypothetical protein